MARSLAVMAEGGWATQASLFQAGRAVSEDCLHCPGCRGTFYHRMRQCPLQDQLRRTTLGKRAGLQKPGARAIEELNDPLLRTGLPRWLDAKTLPPTFNLEYEFGPAHEQHVTWESSSSGEWTRPCFDVGKCGTDGGMKFLAPRRARRSGLAVAVFTPAGEYVLGIWSPCPDLVFTIWIATTYYT